MLLGEFDFSDTFYPDDEEEEVQYDAATNIWFIIFLVLMGIIIMNLLTGLAVDDVNQLRRQGQIVKAKLQIDLALEVEMALPEWFKRSLEWNVRRWRIYPNTERKGFGWWKKVKTLVDGPFLSKDAIYDKVMGLSFAPTLDSMEQRLRAKIRENHEQLEGLDERLERIESLIISFIAQQQDA